MNKSTKTIKTTIPFFNNVLNFYNNEDIHDEIIDEVDYINHYTVDNKVSTDCFEFDFKAYKKDIIEVFVNVFNRYTPEYVESIANPCYMKDLSFLNGLSDLAISDLKADITIKADWKDLMKRWIYDYELNAPEYSNYNWLKKTIENDFSDSAIIENDFDKWIPMLFDEENEIYLNYLIIYQMLKNNPSVASSITYEVFDEIKLADYIIPKKEYESLVSKAREELNTIISW